jgi:hypothetical protein
MRAISIVVALAIAIHTGCGIQCLVGDLELSSNQAASMETPACHKEAEGPSEDSPGTPHHDRRNACGLAQKANASVAGILKGGTLVDTIVLPLPPALLHKLEPEPVLLPFAAANSSPAAMPYLQLSVLRI